MRGYVVALAGLMLSPIAATAGPTSQFTLSGDVGTPGIYTLPSLSLLPVTSENATYKANGHTVTDHYTGALLWDLLSAAGGVTTDPTIKNDLLLHYVVASGSDGYTAVVAAGEIAPKFGDRPYLVAYQDDQKQLTPQPGTDCFARLVLPQDIAGGRYVSNLASISVGSVPAAPSQGGSASTRFTVSGQVATPGTYTLSTLQGLPATQTTVSYLAAGKPVTDSYTGVSLWTLLSAAGLTGDPAIKNDILRKIVVATGSDGYAAVFSLGEIDPAFGAQPDLIAYADTGSQLGAGGSDGFARLVVPNDSAGGRYISNLVSLQVYDATNIAEPAAIAVLLPALMLLGLSRRARAAG